MVKLGEGRVSDRRQSLIEPHPEGFSVKKMERGLRMHAKH